MVTGFSSVAGIIVGVVLAQVMEAASISSQERGNVSESLMAKMSADAGMEDVEDDEGDNKKANSLIEEMAKAQGLKDEEVDKVMRKKVVEDDGW